MKARTAFRLAVGAMVGCALLFMATPAIQAHDHAAEPAFAPPAAAARAPAALPPDVAFGRFIALIRADLMVGDELVKQRDWDVAHGHFMFPLEEIYGVIREDLRGYKTPPFDAALRALARTVDAHSVKRYPKALQKVDVALDAADANLKKRQPNWPSFLLRVSVATLRSAPDEYEDAVANGRIVRPIGYQTARGIVLQVDRMIDGVASDLAGKNPEAMRDLREALAQLKEGFARVNAPRQAVLEVGAVGRLVARVETAADKLM